MDEGIFPGNLAVFKKISQPMGEKSPSRLCAALVNTGSKCKKQARAYCLGLPFVSDTVYYVTFAHNGGEKGCIPPTPRAEGIHDDTGFPVKYRNAGTSSPKSAYRGRFLHGILYGGHHAVGIKLLLA